MSPALTRARVARAHAQTAWPRGSTAESKLSRGQVDEGIVGCTAESKSSRGQVEAANWSTVESTMSAEGVAVSAEGVAVADLQEEVGMDVLQPGFSASCVSVSSSSSAPPLPPPTSPDGGVASGLALALLPASIPAPSPAVPLHVHHHHHHHHRASPAPPPTSPLAPPLLTLERSTSTSKSAHVPYPQSPGRSLAHPHSPPGPPRILPHPLLGMPVTPLQSASSPLPLHEFPLTPMPPPHSLHTSPCIEPFSPTAYTTTSISRVPRSGATAPRSRQHEAGTREWKGNFLVATADALAAIGSLRASRGPPTRGIGR